MLDPLSPPTRWIKWLGEVLRFVHYFITLKLHDTDSLESAAFIRNCVFRNPQSAGSEKPSNAEIGRMAGVMAAEILEIPFAVYAFTGLRVIADYLVIVNLMLDILISSRRSRPVLA